MTPARFGRVPAPMTAADPRQQALAAHLACWQLFAANQANRQAQHLGDHLSPRPVTLTPEFGPDGYLQTLPFTHQPVADLLEINTAMARWLRQELGSWSPDEGQSIGPGRAAKGAESALDGIPGGAGQDVALQANKHGQHRQD